MSRPVVLSPFLRYLISSVGLVGRGSHHMCCGRLCDLSLTSERAYHALGGW